MERDVVVRRVIDFARRHGGVVTRHQAYDVGASNRLLTHLVAQGTLSRVQRGVYVLPGTPRHHVTLLRAALAALGPEAVVSHRSAAWLHGLIDQPPPVLELTTSGGQRILKGAVVHRSRRFSQKTVVRGLPCTDAYRTLIDLASLAEAKELDLALDRALANGLIRLSDMPSVIQQGPGAQRLRRALTIRGYLGGPEPSVLESLMGRLITTYGLPVPKAEVVAGKDGRYRIDYAYAEVRLAMELYGFAWHHSPEQMARDLKRQRKLIAEGWTVLVFTWQDLKRDPAGVAAEIRSAYSRLAQRGRAVAR
jgi:hypothetical protein